VLEDLAEDFFLAGLDEGDDFHGAAAALGAAQGVDLMDAPHPRGKKCAKLVRVDD
jgi:hypothetical protein